MCIYVQSTGSTLHWRWDSRIQSLPQAHRKVIKHKRSMTSPSLRCYKLSYSPACPSASRPKHWKGWLWGAYGLCVCVREIERESVCMCKHDGCLCSWLTQANKLVEHWNICACMCVFGGFIHFISSDFHFVPKKKFLLSSLPSVFSPATSGCCLSSGVGGRLTKREKKKTDTWRGREKMGKRSRLLAGSTLCAVDTLWMQRICSLPDSLAEWAVQCMKLWVDGCMLP